MQLPDRICFDGWTLHCRSGELVRGAARTRLQDHPRQLLLELLAHPGEVVTRETLIARLWPRGVVDFETALNTTVRRLRRALGEQAESARYIETIPRCGYRFIGQLESRPAVDAAGVAAAWQARARGWRAGWIAVAGIAVATVAAGVVIGPGHGPVAVTAIVDPQAQESYRRAEHFLQRRDRGDLKLARRYFEDAVALDPDFAEAWVGIASAYLLSTYHQELPAEQGLPKVRDAAERALDLDPTLAIAHVRLASYWSLSGDRKLAQEHLRAARELRPDDAIVLSFEASRLMEEGRFDQAIAAQRRAVELEPLAFSTRYNLASFLFLAGRVAEAEAELNRLRELDPDRRDPAELYGVLLLTTGRYAEALVMADGWDEGFDREYVRAVALDGLGRRDEADASLRRMIERHGDVEGFRIAEVYAHRGDVDAAFRWLQSGIASARAIGWCANGRRPIWLLDDWPLLRAARQDPRWASWYAAALLPPARSNAG